MYIAREIKEKFNKMFQVYGIIAVVGARQAGKTTFLKEQAKHLDSSYALFDDPDVRTLFEEDVKKFEKQYIEGHDVSVLDEVQYCKDAGMKLKYLVDVGKKLWITSSSEIILGKEILSYLVGRVSIIRLYPFSFSEFLTVKGQKALTPAIIERSAWEHMTYGGYPKVVLTEDTEIKRTILDNLYETMILKDVARTFSIEDINSLEKFARYLSANLGGTISYEHVSNDLGISFPTLKKYFNALEKGYLIVRVSPFYTNKSKEIVKQPKVYFLDTGLRNAVARSHETKPDGKLFENYVFSELIKMGLSVKYWRTKSSAEVDFVVEKDKALIPIEVKLRAEPSKIERSMRSFIDTYRPKTALVVVYKPVQGEIKVNDCRVVFTDIVGLRKRLMS